MKRGWSGSLTPKLHLFPILLIHPLPLISAPQVWFQGRDLAGLSLDNQAEQVWGVATCFPTDQRNVCGREAKG